MTKLQSTTLVATLVAGLAAGCGTDDPTTTGYANQAAGQHRFVGKTEAEMATIVRDAICGFYERCADELSLEWATPHTDCQQALDDERYYQAPIDDATRTQLDACLSAIAAASCVEGDEMGDKGTGPCAAVHKYLDLK